MAEHRLEGPVIGVAFDGTGYGTDGAIWGSEVLVCDAADFERRYHLRYIPLAGGDTGAREPWRPALAYLADAGLDLSAAPALERVNERRLRIVRQMIASGVQTIPTSSCGRLFDAVSAILDICFENRYEAEAAMELEAAASSAPPDLGSFGFDLSDDEIDLRQTFRDITTALRNREAIPAISAKFHSTLARAIDAACRAVRAADGVRVVCLSGGSFQNRRLLEETLQVLERSGFKVFFPLEVPLNDGGLSLGQAVIANTRVGK
jgi:hydrogenase maturation protein HypF